MGGLGSGTERPGAGLLGPEVAGRRRSNRLLPARPGEHAEWPPWVEEPVRDGCRRIGVDRPWRHQVQAAEAARSGRHVVLTTGTASGKSLGYLLPILDATFSGRLPPFVAAGGGEALDPGWRQRPHTALYLAPTKALAHDQLRSCGALGPDGWRVAAVDGDSEPGERAWARDYATVVLTNPDLLHHSLLPQHPRWRGLLQSLRYVVIDEAHRYRGVFGAQVAAVVRRLRRLAAHYGTRPVFVLASATASDPLGSAQALTGLDQELFDVVDHDTSARGAVQVDLWQPEETAEDAAAALLAAQVAAGRQTIAFVASRRLTEVIALQARAEIRTPPGGQGPAIEAYRGGYLAADRRRIEADLRSGRLRGVAATNALELGVDVAGMDAVVLCGYPGSRAAFWQQAGRAGRRGRDATVSMVARRHPLDAYLLDHPETLFDGAAEPCVLHPGNPYVLGPQLGAAAQELPLTEIDREYFGTTGWELAARLAEHGRELRRRPGGYYWTGSDRATARIDLRSAGGSALDIIEQDTGRVLGHVEEAAADLVLHPGAVYLHLGDSYLCEEWDHERGEVLVRAAQPSYLTQSQQRREVTVLRERAVRAVGAGHVHLGEVEVATQVTGFLRRDRLTGRVWDNAPLDLPLRRTRTIAVWCTLVESALPSELATGSAARLDAGLHAAEHAILGLLPAFAPCDRYDIDSHSDLQHPDTAAPTLFVYDSHAGGTGFADRAFTLAEAWLRASHQRVRDCDCGSGCPSCILTGCGSSRGLDRRAAGEVLLLFAS